MKNNWLALAFYLIFLLESLLLLVLFVMVSPIAGSLMQARLLRIGLALVMLANLFWLGSKLRLETSSKGDYFVGILIVLIGVGLVAFSVGQTTHSFFALPTEEQSLYGWMGPNGFLLPCTFLCFLLDIERYPWVMAAFSFLPGLIMGAGLRWRRRKRKA